jgi:hypothetical protein
MMRSKVLMCRLSAVLILALLPGCGAQRGYSGYLRGDELLYLRLPIQDGRQESIVSGKQHLASRSFDPVTVQTHINRVMIPDSLWMDLENLRHDWCNQPPEGASLAPNDTDFVIVFQCGKVQNPVNAVVPSDLPQPLRALIDLVPSTSERLIVP